MTVTISINKIGFQYIIVFLTFDDLRFHKYYGIVYFYDPDYIGYLKHNGIVEVYKQDKPFGEFKVFILNMYKIDIPDYLPILIDESILDNENKALLKVKKNYLYPLEIRYNPLNIAIISEIDKALLIIKHNESKKNIRRP